MKSFFLFASSVIAVSALAQQSIQKYQPVGFSEVQVTDTFWKPKMDKVATATLQACISQTEIKTPRIRNFQKVTRNQGEKFEGLYYDDSDVYKALEAIAYSIKTHGDPNLEATADRWIDIVAAAQMPDGYLDTFYQLGNINKRWTDIPNHEDYNAGHLIEAAVAYYQATGKRKLLDVAIRLANHINNNFRLQNKPWFSGHQEIELALMKLYHLTLDDRYLKLADWYLQQRGRHYYTYGKNWITPDYWQDMAPVKDQKEITGHAVRAMYMYSGIADVAAVTGDPDYLKAMKTVWEDVVDRNMYLTGGIGSAGNNEGFTKDYDLPNDQAYCETCASVGMVFWNHRMNQLTGESQYIDILEKSLYNAALDGLSLTGDRFFYDNPLASNGQHHRDEWFGTACCPANISRLVASLGNYIYGKNEKSIWVNLFVASRTSVRINDTDVAVRMETNYPWDGNIKLNIDPARKTKFSMYLHIPGWAQGQPMQGDLYRFADFHPAAFSLKVNGKDVPSKKENGYLIVERDWLKGDLVEYTLPMQVNLVVAKEEVKYDNDRIALQRGPLVYCVEGADNNGKAWDVIVPDHTTFTTRTYKVIDEPVIAIDFGVNAITVSSDGQNVQLTKKNITAIPYYTWANRGANEMQIWLPTKIKDVKLNN